ncbi:MAG: helix-turn-helix transcriptional regulator [Candidatus Aureabacteria bacterium]|nr:helix-turn-helix transcriptional regulator [Candidatus Auribacterota bacterium]
MIFGKNLKKLRLYAGYNQRQVAQKLGVSVSTISSWENGKKLPYGKNLQKVIDFFSITEADIFSDNIEKILQKQDFIDFTHERIKIKDGIFLIAKGDALVSHDAALIRKAEKILKALFE